MRQPAGLSHWGYIRSDPRKKVLANLNYANGWGAGQTMRSSNYTLTLRWQPLNAMNVSLSAGKSTYWRKQDQFVRNVTSEGQTRTIVGEVNQDTWRYTLRLNDNITPDLTLQYYGQPFSRKTDQPRCSPIVNQTMGEQRGWWSWGSVCVFFATGMQEDHRQQQRDQPIMA